MTKAIAAGIAVVMAICTMFVPGAGAANSRGGHSANPTGHAAPYRHHRAHRFYSYAPYYYGYGYDYGADVAPPPAPAAKPAAVEVRRGCESQTYSVPSSSGGESQVTVLRC